MIIDAFTFFNELDLLEIRLETLDSVVDQFILVEAELTQTGQPKPLYFANRSTEPDRFAKWRHKILNVIIPAAQCPSNNGNLWAMENFQRNYIKKGVEHLQLYGDRKPVDTDVVMISDLDEIPNPEMVKQAALMDGANCLAFGMSFHAYYANLVSPKKGWVGTVMTKVETLNFIEPQDLRNIKDSAPRIDDAGWHLSWLGGWEKAYTKLNSCIEPLDKREVPSPEEFKKKFEERIKDGGYFHLTTDDNSVPLAVNNSAEILPPYLHQNREKFPKFFI
jgi:beta-1,4-mannosyl-glycoprotein beta-1,4-N-acetylglucosaminyltransferase